MIRSTRRSTTIIESWSCGRLYYKLTLLLLFIFYFIAIHQLKKSRNWKITTSHVTRRLSSHFCVFHCHRDIKPINIEICFLKTFLDRNTSLIGYFQGTIHDSINGCFINIWNNSTLFLPIFKVLICFH